MCVYDREAEGVGGKSSQLKSNSHDEQVNERIKGKTERQKKERVFTISHGSIGRYLRGCEWKVLSSHLLSHIAYGI